MITWRAHYVVGWDPRAATYHVTYVDNNGSASLLHGRIGGQRFVIEAPLEGVGPGKVTWRNECSIAGGPLAPRGGIPLHAAGARVSGTMALDQVRSTRRLTTVDIRT